MVSASVLNLMAFLNLCHLLKANVRLTLVEYHRVYKDLRNNFTKRYNLHFIFNNL